MPIANKSAAAVTHKFVDDGRIPNNRTLPFILYRGAVDLAGSPDPELIIAKTFGENGWGGFDVANNRLWKPGWPLPHAYAGVV